MNSRPLYKNDSGFTLIEVMISLVILCFISMGIYQATTEAYHLRDVLSTEGEFYNSIRMAMDVMQRDVAAIYSPTIGQPTPRANPSGVPTTQNPQQTQEMMALSSSDAGKTSAYWEPAVDKTGLRPSRFVGTDNKLTFITSSHTRIYKDSPESDFSKVSYELVHDEDSPAGSDLMTLVRTENTDTFEDDDRHALKYQRKFPLLHGIKSFKYRYWRKDTSPTGKWDNSWDTDKEDTKNVFPDIIEVKLEVVGREKLTYDGIYQFRPEVPLRAMDPSS
jgi:general secretion pathway protein J